MSANEVQRKCAKCHITAEHDDSLRFHRFPLPGKHGSLKARVWAEYCFPDKDWSTEKSLTSLHKQHKMLCSKHFDVTSYTSSSRNRLNKFAVPIGTESLMLKLRQEQSSTSRITSTNLSIPDVKLQALVTECTVPVEESTLDDSTTTVLEVPKSPKRTLRKLEGRSAELARRKHILFVKCRRNLSALVKLRIKMGKQRSSILNKLIAYENSAIDLMKLLWKAA